MTDEKQGNEYADPEATPQNEDLEEPSTEKEPGHEPTAPAKGEPEPSHEAVGIGVIGRPQTGLDEPEEADPSAEG